MEKNLPHIKILQPHRAYEFTSVGAGGGSGSRLPQRDREEHGRRIMRELKRAGLGRTCFLSYFWFVNDGIGFIVHK